MYSLMARGGDAYLKIEEVMAMLGPYKTELEVGEWAKWEKKQVEEDLNTMKDYAAKMVRDLMVNELMGDIKSEGGEGAVEYLTCTKVAEKELPWVAVAVAQNVGDENER